MINLLSNIRLFEGLSDAELEEIRPLLVEKRVQKGERLFEEGAMCEQIFVIVAGKVKLTRFGDSGREQILELLGPGDSCACHPGVGNWCCSASAEAVSETALLLLRRQDYIRLVQNNSKLSLTLSKIFARRLQAVNALVEQVSLKDVKKRLVTLLLTLARERGIPIPRGVLIPTDFTREELAARIGTSRETVVRYLYELKKAKLIDLKSRRQITILDPAALERLR
ncbi:MAG: Crp/Fnr family transcriptional regulator [Elusimicrobia bacterium]|nr:Crp/Fnr family transcriptional regulator [Elusimicrobiota bacterium]